MARTITVEGIIALAFRLGALSASSDIRPERYKRLSIEWPSYWRSSEYQCFTVTDDPALMLWSVKHWGRSMRRFRRDP